MNEEKQYFAAWKCAGLCLALCLHLFPGESVKLRSEELPSALTLETAVQNAWQKNETALRADERLAAAKARLSKARSYFFPNLSLSGTYTRRPFEVKREFNNQTIVVQSLNALSGNLSLSYVFFDSRYLPALFQAGNETKAEAYNRLESKRKLAYEVAAAFLMTLTLDRVTEAAHRRMELAQQILNAAKARFASGLVSINDVTRAELEFASAEKALIEIRGEEKSAYLHLGYLMDTPVSGVLVTPDWLIQAAESPPPEAEPEISLARERRPDIHALHFRLQAAKSSSLEPLLRWLPSLAFNGQYRYTNEAGLTGRSTNWNLGISMNWTLFDGNQRLADSREKRALARIADLDLKSTLRLSELEIKDALISLLSRQSAQKQARLAREIAEKNSRETAEMYRQGLSGILQVADANQQFFEAEVGLAQARADLAAAFLNFQAAQGLDPFGKEMKP